MARFWLGTFKVSPPAVPSGSPVEPLVSGGARAVAIEVINEGDEYAVLFSTLEDADSPQSLVCGLGLVNGAKACGVWHDRGFPLVDAVVTYDQAARRLLASAPYFSEPGSKHAMQYGETLVAIDGLEFDEASDAGGNVNPAYLQVQQSPDPESPATGLLRRSMRWEPTRTKVKKLAPVPLLRVQIWPSRLPSLRPFGTAPLPLANAWSGRMTLPSSPAHVGDKQHAKRTDIFGVPAFRFGKIEVVGFRIELGKLPYSLVEPLNFPSSSAQSVYVPTTAVVLVELLRYGSMRLQKQEAPLTDADFQSQHELVVRVAVGRIPPDGSTKPRDPAVWVPTIFVDNTWSRGLGRDVQGFDKRMAQFCVRDETGKVPLRPDGCRSPGRTPSGVVEVAAIDLAERTGGDAASGQPLLDIRYSSPLHERRADFQTVEPGTAGFPHGGPRWRRSDFNPEELDASFVSRAVSYSFFDFLSLQVAPAGKRMFDNTFIRSTFSIVGKPEFEEPAVGGVLTLHPSAAAPSAWNELCKLVGLGDDGTAQYPLATGRLYRLKFSMNVTVNDR